MNTRLLAIITFVLCLTIPAIAGQGKDGKQTTKDAAKSCCAAKTGSASTAMVHTADKKDVAVAAHCDMEKKDGAAHKCDMDKAGADHKCDMDKAAAGGKCDMDKKAADGTKASGKMDCCKDMAAKEAKTDAKVAKPQSNNK